MISRSQRINALSELGLFLNDPQNQSIIDDWAYRANLKNNWFDPHLVKLSLSAIASKFLEKDILDTWVAQYPVVTEPIKIGVVMAGNIPAVGFHDILCVLVSGHQLLAKPSSDDQVLINLLLDKLIEIEPALKNQIEIVERLNAADAYIATGSDNTARYFHYYFSKKPHIIRKSRSSVAVLTGQESKAELLQLGQDILLYYGLGCRNVSKLYVPVGYDFTVFYDAIETMAPSYLNHHKYFNNYEYNKSIVLINRVHHYDNGFLIAVENEALVSPISMVHYETYNSLEEVATKLETQKEKLQCIVTDSDLKLKSTVRIGNSQFPEINDYADDVDTMHFLNNLI